MAHRQALNFHDGVTLDSLIVAVAKKKSKFETLFEELESSLVSGDCRRFEELYSTLSAMKASRRARQDLEIRRIQFYWQRAEFDTALRRVKTFQKKFELSDREPESGQLACLKAVLTAIKGQTGQIKTILVPAIERGDDFPDLVPWLKINLAIYHRDSGAWQEARDLLKSIIANHGDNPEILTRSALILAELHSDMQWGHVTEWTAVVRETASKWGGWSYLKVAEILDSLQKVRDGDFSLGMSQLYKHYTEADQLEDLVSRIRVRMALAECLTVLGDAHEAKTVITESKNLLDSSGETGLKHYQSFLELLWFTNLTQDATREDFLEALDRLEILLAVVSKYARPPGSSVFWLEIGRLQSRLGLVDNAVKSLSRAVKDAEGADTPRIRASALFTLAEVKWNALPDDEKSRGGARNQIIALTASALDDLSVTPNPDILWRVHLLRGRIFLASGEQYPANGEMVAAAETVTALLEKMTDSGIRKIFQSAVFRKPALEQIQKYLPEDRAIVKPVSARKQKALVTGEISGPDRPSREPQQLKTMLSAIYDIHATADPVALIHRFLQHLGTILEADRLYIRILDVTTTEIRSVFKTRSDTESDRVFAIPPDWVKETELTKHAMIFRRSADEDSLESRTVICAPLWSNGTLWGSVYIDRPEKNKPFQTPDIAVLEAVCQAMLLTYSNLHLQHRLASLTDEFRKEIIPHFPHIVGDSDAIKEVYLLIQKVAPADMPVLITGATGTGKDLVARTIHEVSHRHDAPFVYLDCSAIPVTLLESELFGIEKGVATGVEHRIGLLEYANGGTVLLDEVAGIPLSVQAKLLRVLQERQFEPVGSDRTVSVDIRLISTTSQDLKTMIARNLMRDDFFYRISGVVIDLPPLKDRTGDVILLARTFLQKYNSEFKKQVEGFEPELLDAMVAYAWPGNVRELDNVIQKAVLFSQNNRLTLAETGLPRAGSRQLRLEDALALMEYRSCREAVEICMGDMDMAARCLDIPADQLETRLAAGEARFESPLEETERGGKA